MLEAFFLFSLLFFHSIDKCFMLSNELNLSFLCLILQFDSVSSYLSSFQQSVACHDQYFVGCHAR